MGLASVAAPCVRTRDPVDLVRARNVAMVGGTGPWLVPHTRAVVPIGTPGLLRLGAMAVCLSRRAAAAPLRRLGASRIDVY